MGGNRSYKDFAALPLFYLMAVPEVQNLRCVAPITFVAEKMRLKSKVQRTDIIFSSLISSLSLFNILSLYSSFIISLFATDSILTVYCSLLSYQPSAQIKKVQSSLKKVLTQSQFVNFLLFTFTFTVYFFTSQNFTQRSLLLPFSADEPLSGLPKLLSANVRYWLLNIGYFCFKS